MASNVASESYLLIDELEETLASGDGRDCEKMLARVADLFMAGSRRYSDEQIALFDDVLLRLAAEIEMHARAKLAQQLAYVDNAPPKLIRSFAFDDSIDVARPVLARSARLSDAVGTMPRPAARIASAMPGNSKSRSACVASGVRSCG